MKGLIPTALIVSVGALLAGCGGKSAESLASVNGDSITMEQFNEYLMVKPTVAVITNNGPATAQVADTLAFQALNDLVRQRVLLQMAKDEGVFPTDAEVGSELDFQTKLRPNFVRDLTARGLTLDMIRRDLTVQVAQQKLLTKGINVTMEEVDQFIKDNPARFTRPESAQMLWIVVDDAGRAAVDADLRAGQAFASVAVRRSAVPNARENQGRLVVQGNPNVPLSTLDQLAPGLANTIRNTPEGRQTGWIRSGQQFAKFLVERKQAAEKQTLSDAQKEQLRREIAATRGSAALDLNKRILDRLKEARVTVNVQPLREPWNRAMKRLTEEGEQPAGNPTGTEPPKTTEAPKGN